MRVVLVSTHRSDRAHYGPLKRLLENDARFEVLYGDWAPVYNGRPADVGVVLGDRYEMLQRAIQFAEERVPLVHIHGGEHTTGSLDERWRWAMTMIADRHCVVNEEAQWEVDKHILGDAKPGFTDAYRKLSLRSFVTGAPGLDDIHQRQPVRFPHLIIVHHNPVIDDATTRREFMAIIAGLGFHTPKRLASLEQTLWIAPNGDRYSAGRGVQLEPSEYRDELAAAHVIVGNSSAGIIEAPSLGTWAVNVGDRQRGRQRGLNVIDVSAEPFAIREAVADVLARPRAPTDNPYGGDGHASERIRDVILSLA